MYKLVGCSPNARLAQTSFYACVFFLLRLWVWYLMNTIDTCIASSFSQLLQEVVSNNHLLTWSRAGS